MHPSSLGSLTPKAGNAQVNFGRECQGGWLLRYWGVRLLEAFGSRTAEAELRGEGFPYSMPSRGKLVMNSEPPTPRPTTIIIPQLSLAKFSHFGHFLGILWPLLPFFSHRWPFCPAFGRLLAVITIFMHNMYKHPEGIAAFRKISPFTSIFTHFG